MRIADNLEIFEYDGFYLYWADENDPEEDELLGIFSSIDQAKQWIEDHTTFEEV